MNKSIFLIEIENMVEQTDGYRHQYRLINVDLLMNSNKEMVREKQKYEINLTVKMKNRKNTMVGYFSYECSKNISERI